MKRAVGAFCDGTNAVAEQLRWSWCAEFVAMDLWDDESFDVLVARHIELAQQVGALDVLPIALSAGILVQTFAGRLPLPTR